MLKINYAALALSCAYAMLLSGCHQADINASKNLVQVSVEDWGKANNQTVHLYTLKNEQGMTVKVSDWGGYLQSIKVADKNGQFEDVLVGYDSWPEYYNDCCYAGPIVGRFGNRIAGAEFEIDGVKYSLSANDGGENKDINQLHGGFKGLHKRLWQSEVIPNGVQLSYLSKDMEEGYPGNLQIKLNITLDNDNALKLEYFATTDKKTHVNLTSHTYINLTGDMKSDIENHILQIKADKITPVDHYLIPTGELANVVGTPFDFTQPKEIAQDIRQSNQQLKFAGGQDKRFGGYDHNWVFTDYDGSLKNQVSLYEPQSGRLLEIYTQEPAIQFYSGNFMDGTMTGKQGKPVLFRYGLALEPQHFPDSPNQANFPSTLLKPGETYHTVSSYKFSVK
ncbi:galactose mutarotase [Catenovulum sp. 2E275]|uniref:aldose epimerase family protein n=1 Tax=Catenovulum sp. 2E275 TaxID=2980497 RepID=UPI0021CE104D|nr:aldose epimerase family protein [Catenovulum sp. 2E275]MCU4675987.1 galactose mutarotase [Catenovulum sp. 2E275]